MSGPISPLLRLPSAAVLLLSTAFLLLVCAAPASARPAPVVLEDRVTPAEHYAALLAEEPEGTAVVVDDALAGEYELEELETALHDSFGRLGVPYHVVAIPRPGGGGEWSGEILPALIDRADADGLYALLQPGSSPRVRAEGVELPVEAAVDVVDYSPELAYDAPVDEVATVLADALADPDVDTRADLLRQDHRSRYGIGPGTVGWGRLLDGVDPTSYTGPGRLGALVGGAGGALFVLSLVGAVRLTRRGPGILAGGALVVVVGLALPAAGVFGALAYLDSVPPVSKELPSRVDEHKARPPHVTSTVRVERVLEGMGEGSVYVDPLSSLSREGLASAAERAEEASVPLRVAMIPMVSSDESGGDPHLFLHAMHHVAGEEGVYAVFTARHDGTVRVSALAFGLGVREYHLTGGLYEREPPNTPVEALETLLDVVESAPRDQSARDPDPPTASTAGWKPREERFREDLLPSALIFGPLVGAALAWIVLKLPVPMGAMRRVREAGVSSGSLRRMAETERARLASLVARGPQAVPHGFMPQIEAALMVMEADPDDLDRLGVVVVSRRAHAALEDPASADGPPCTVNPLHGPATTRRRSEVTKGMASLCRECADLPDARRVERVLRVRGPGGVRRSHLSLEERAWVRHRFGALHPARMVDRLLEEIHVR
ncbi:hypothetical protein [Nocardiopsis sp. ATB16-24]|uniref:hypothetical protein n=1 Tax=Nocardiopsis sp. ATB16-24 TaxID=3019555 RepID=UPI002555D1A2|nr:hypothetical protein [Nocardiopsis sp. ATB16-24]